MQVVNTLRRSAVAVTPDRPITEVAALMDVAGVGAIAVVDGERLVGIVTDRDLTVRALGRGLAPDTRVDAVMSAPVLTIAADADLHEAFQLFHSNAVRRLAVVSGGRFLGMVTADDLLIDLAADLQDLARPITAEVVFGHHGDGAPVGT